MWATAWRSNCRAVSRWLGLGRAAEPQAERLLVVLQDCQKAVRPPLQQPKVLDMNENSIVAGRRYRPTCAVGVDGSRWTNDLVESARRRAVMIAVGREHHSLKCRIIPDGGDIASRGDGVADFLG